MLSQPFTIRRTTADDVPALAALHVTTFNETHGSFNSPALATRLAQWQQMFEHQDANWFCLVIEKNDGILVGFAKGQPYHDIHPSGFAGELNKIYILREYQKLGLGRQLLCNVANEFLQREISSMLLFGDANSLSNKFYENMGGEKLFAKNGDFHGGYGWRNLNIVVNFCVGI